MSLNDTVDVWTIDLAVDERELAARRALLDSAERARAAQFHFDRDRNRYVAGRAALRRILGAHLGVHPADVRFSYGAHGKPAVEGAPDFNVAHTGDVALVAITTLGPVGVDVEMIQRMPDIDAVARSHFSTVEQEALARLGPDQRHVGFFRCWTRKEAFIKALGEGLSHPLDRFDVSLDPAAAGMLAIAGDTRAAADWSLPLFEPRSGYLAALAVRTPLATLRIRPWMG